MKLIRTRQEAHGQFEREPNYTNGLYKEEWICDIGYFIFLYLGAVGCRIEHLVMLKLGQCLQTKYNDGQKYNEN